MYIIISCIIICILSYHIICIISYHIIIIWHSYQIASPGSTHETGCSGLVHWNDPEGWDGEGGEGGSGWGTMETVADFILGGSQNTVDGDCSHEIKRCLLLGRKHIQKQRHYFANKGSSSQGYGFSCGHVWM